MPDQPITKDHSDRLHVWATLIQTKRMHPATIGVTINNRWRQLRVVAFSDEEAQELIALLRDVANE